MSFDPFPQDQPGGPPPEPRPDGYYPAPETPPATAARNAVMAPGIFLIVVGVLNLLSGFGGIAIGGMFASIPPDKFEEVLTKSQPKQYEELKKQGYTAENLKSVYTTSGIGGGLAISFFALLTILGGILMLMLRAYGLAIFAAVLTAVPCVSPMSCPCLFGMGVGIWALVVLLGEDARSGFR